MPVIIYSYIVIKKLPFKLFNLFDNKLPGLVLAMSNV